MKILKSFDTSIDAEELTEAIKKYGEWNVILVKKHRIRLLIPLFLVILSIFLLNLMLYIIYTDVYETNKIIFWILAVFYVYTTISRSIYTILWIMTNIIGQINSKNKFIEDASLAEVKKRSFEKFLKRTFLTFLAHVIVLIFNATIPFIVIKSTWIWSIAIAIWALAVDIIFLIVVNRVMFRLIEYEMNFGIYTKDMITSFRQEWFFKTKAVNVATPSIKIIQTSKDWIASALFHYWTIDIITDSEWENKKNQNNLSLSYIPDPRRLVKKLNNLILKHQEGK